MIDKILKRSFIFSFVLHALIVFGIPRGCTMSKEAKQEQAKVEELKDSMENFAEEQGLPEALVEKVKEMMDRDFESFIARQEEEKIPKRTMITLVERGKYVPPEPKPECKAGKYVGVGFTYSSFLEDAPRVTEVAPGYAADKAGLKENDLIMGVVDHRDPTLVQGISIISDYPVVDTYIDMLIIRDGVSLRLTMTREEICYNKKESKND